MAEEAVTTTEILREHQRRGIRIQELEDDLAREREARERAERERDVALARLRREAAPIALARAEKAEAERDRRQDLHLAIRDGLAEERDQARRDLADAVEALRKLIRAAEQIGIDPDGFNVWIPEPLNSAVADARAFLHRLGRG